MLIRPGHLFLGLLGVEDGTAVEILSDLGVVPGTLRERSIGRLGTREPSPDERLRRLLREAAGGSEVASSQDRDA